MNRIITYMCLLSVMVSCVHKDLCYDHDDHALMARAEVHATYDLVWEYQVPDMRPRPEDLPYDLLEPDMPSGLRALVYGPDAAGRVTNLPAQGALLYLTPGKCDILFHNNDTEGIIFDDMDHIAMARAYTRNKVRPGYSKGPESRTVGEPDVLFGASVMGYDAVLSHISADMPVRMTPLVYAYYIRCRFSKGAEHIVLARGALEGMAHGVYLTNGYTTDESCSVLFDARVQSYGADAVVRSFGVPAYPNSHFNRSVSRDEYSYGLTLEVRLRNGKTKTFTIDITDQMNTAPQGGVILIDGLVITDQESAGNDAGFNVDVNDWGEFEDIPILM